MVIPNAESSNFRYSFFFSLSKSVCLLSRCKGTQSFQYCKQFEEKFSIKSEIFFHAKFSTWEASRACPYLYTRVRVRFLCVCFARIVRTFALSAYTKVSNRRRDGHRGERGAGSSSRKRGGSAKGGADRQAVTADRGTCPMGTKIARTGLSGLSEGVTGTPYIYDNMIILRPNKVRWIPTVNLSREHPSLSVGFLLH